MKKRLAVMLTAALGCSLLSGCSGGGSTGGGAQQAAQGGSGDEAAGGAASVDPSAYEVTEPITIQWWHALEDQYSQTVAEIVEGFNSSQDLITVEATYVGSYAQTNEALVAANAAGTGLPAVTVANTPYVAEYGAGGLTEDLTPYIQATGFEIDDFGKGMVDASSYDGKQVALPFLISTQIMYYNKDMADAEGIAIPEKWDDMDAFLEKASVVNGGATERYGTIIPGWDQWYFETFYLNQGVKLINDDRVSTDLDSEAAVGLVNQFRGWVDKGYVNWTTMDSDASSNMRQAFIDGKAFSVIHTRHGVAAGRRHQGSGDRRLCAFDPLQERPGYQERGMAVFVLPVQQGSKYEVGQGDRLYPYKKFRAPDRRGQRIPEREACVPVHF